MKRLILRGLALGMLVGAFAATAPARAGEMKFCFETTGKDKRFLQTVDNDKRFHTSRGAKPYFANATACTGGAVITVGDANRNPGTTPKIGAPVYLYSHQKKFLVVSKAKVRGANNRYYEFELLFPGSGFNEWNQFVLLPADPKVRKGTPLAAGMTFHIVPKLARKRFKILADMGTKSFNGVIAAYQAMNKSTSTTFKLVAPGAAKPPQTAQPGKPAQPALPPRPAQAGKPKWGIYGGPWAPPRLHKDGDLVTLTGLVKGRWDGHVWTIPRELAPRQRLIFSTNNHDRQARVDISPNGMVSFHAGGRYQDWLSLAGIQYSLKAAQPAALKSGWQPYGHEYAPPGYAKQGSVVSIQGLVRGNAKQILVLPAGYRPRQRLIFNMNNHDASYRLDIDPNGTVLWVAGGKKHGWLSLSGVTFNTKPGKRLALAGGWSPYGRGHADPAASITGKTVMVTGLVKHAKFNGHIATLPAGMRPPQILVFNANNHDGQTRLNVLPDGRIMYGGGQKKHGWINLTGMTFAVK